MKKQSEAAISPTKDLNASTYEKRRSPSGDCYIGNETSSVAVAIVGGGNVDLAPHLYHALGRFKTENLGIEKMIAFLVRRPKIRHLVVCGREEFGHYPADALLCLHRNGVDGEKRIIGTRAPIPYLCNTPLEAIAKFRLQLTLHDLVEPKEAEEIIEYNPRYDLDSMAKRRLEELLESLAKIPTEPFGQPLIYDSPIIEREDIGEDMNQIADRIVGGMLGFSDEKLSISSRFIILNRNPDYVINPVDGMVSEVPSAELIRHLRDYLSGGL